MTAESTCTVATTLQERIEPFLHLSADPNNHLRQALAENRGELIMLEYYFSIMVEIINLALC